MSSDRTVVVVPWRGDDGGPRDRSFDLVLPRIEALGYPVVVSDSGDEPFSIARTWNLLVGMATASCPKWDRVVFWGADFIIEDDESVHRAVAHDGGYVFAFDRALRATEAQTAAIHASGRLPDGETKLPFGGPRAVSRAAWDAVGGYDERFVGWGHEDRVFVYHLRAAGINPERVPGRLIMLWHPRDPDYMARQHANHDLYRQITGR